MAGMAGPALAEAADPAVADASGAVAAAPAAASDAAVILEPIALAILHHARGDASWSSRAKLRNALKTAAPAGPFGINAAASPAVLQLTPEARNIVAAWQSVITATNVFQRSRDFQKLVGLMDAYAARVLSAERYLLPLNGQGFMSYDDLDQDLINDAGLVDSGVHVAATRFVTFDAGTTGALQVMNLHVHQLTPSLKAPSELYRVSVPDTELAEKLLKGKAGMVQMVELRLRGETPRCFPHAEAMKGVQRPLPALAVEFMVMDPSTGEKLFTKPIEHALRQGRKGYCSVA